MNGYMWMGARGGAALAPPIAAWFIVSIGWRETFYLFGSVGVIWCFFSGAGTATTRKTPER